MERRKHSVQEWHRQANRAVKRTRYVSHKKMGRSRKASVFFDELEKKHRKRVKELYAKHGVGWLTRILSEELGKEVSMTDVKRLIEHLAIEGELKKRKPRHVKPKKPK